MADLCGEDLHKYPARASGMNEYENPVDFNRSLHIRHIDAFWPEYEHHYTLTMLFVMI